MIERVDLDEPHDRTKRLLLQDRRVGGHLHQRWLEEVSEPIQFIAPVQELPALLEGDGESRLGVGNGIGADQRPHQCALIQRIPDRDLGIRIDELLGEHVSDRLVHQESP